MKILRCAFALGLIGAWMPAPVSAQRSPADRLDNALAVTDSRIEAAAAQLRDTPHPEAQLALERAQALQFQAREVVQRGGPPRRAGNLTMRARSQAERAIAIMRGLPDADRVQGQLERTHAMLESARARVAGCDDRSVRDLLHEADDVQRRAEAAAGEGRPLAALQLTFAARERGQEALRRCRVQDDPADRAGRALEATDSLIARARAIPDGAGSPRDMLDRADALQAQARDAYRAGRFPLALRLATDAGALARRAARLSDSR
jgi:hypothetical protein